MWNKLLKILNIHADANQKWLLWTMAISGLLATYTSPILLKTVITDLPAQWIAIESVVLSITSLFIGMLWQGKARKKAINNFAKLAIIECTCTFLLAMYLCFIDYNPWVYGIGSLIYTSLIVIFVGKCIMCFKAKLWIEKDREVYDNNLSIVGGIVCVIGYLVALLAMPPLKLALFLWGFCCIFDDLGWIIVYFKNKEKLIEYGDTEENT